MLGTLESATMGVLWSSEDALSVRQVLDVLNVGRDSPLAYTTVMTVLGRLHRKGVLERQRSGRGFCYTPAVRDEAAIAVRSVIKEYGDAALTHFAEHARADPELLRRLRALTENE
ncbi:MAG: BlaI/MecI/CopY family transcriptional regulator [Acidimicrobiia bacterium]|jgi:predicted transcriptional regulator|nr:BlaI/MecI/CopY family transcriptional regulator [Acidimicrobiia bacterium]MDQ3392245.1 BlaI/MecI/CopY family transcriptional regulator [Actinomycetota bacterium]